MSVSGFVVHGYHRGLVMTRDGGSPFGEIRLYDIGEDDLVGAQYVIDGTKQAQPLHWHPGIERALKHHRGGDGTARPTLRKSRVEPSARSASTAPSEPDNESERPSLKQKQRPRLRGRHG